MDKSQENTTKFTGLGAIIAKKTGFSNDYISRVLNNRVQNQKAKKQGVYWKSLRN
ncbi:MAG: hypothetical protein R2764_01320 [Bacteroidales bacterium]